MKFAENRDISEEGKKEKHLSRPYLAGCSESCIELLKNFTNHKQPSSGVLRKRCSENMQYIYRRTPVLKCGFNKVSKQLC